jgi:hypothetical protein
MQSRRFCWGTRAVTGTILSKQAARKAHDFQIARFFPERMRAVEISKVERALEHAFEILNWQPIRALSQSRYRK